MLAQGHRAGDGSRRQGRLETPELAEIGLGLLEIGLESGLRLRVRGPQDFIFELIDLLGKGRELPFDEGNAAIARIWSGQVLPRPLGGDHLHAGTGRRIHLVALPVIPVEVGVDDLADGLLRDALDLRVDRPGRRRLGVGIDNDHPIVGHDDRGIRVDLVRRRRDGRVHAVRDPFELEEVFVGGLGVGRQDTAELVWIERVNGRCRDPDPGQHLSTRPLRAHRAPPPSDWLADPAARS